MKVRDLNRQSNATWRKQGLGIEKKKKNKSITNALINNNKMSKKIQKKHAYMYMYAPKKSTERKKKM
jgi:hypothetical protein